MPIFQGFGQWKSLFTRILRGWVRRQRVVFLFVCLLVVLAGVWKGYQDVYLFQWTDEQKNDYREKSLTLVQFRAELFDRAVKFLRQQEADFSAQTGDDRDIFGAGPIRTLPPTQ